MSTKSSYEWRKSLERLRDDFEQQVSQISRRLKKLDPTEAGGTLASMFSRGMGAAVDMDEDENEVRVRAEMPGVDADTLKVEIQGQRLTLRGEKKAETHETRRDCYYTECTYGEVTRTVTLPCEVDADKAAADYRDGVLTLKLPKPEGVRRRTIHVNVNRPGA